MLESIRQSMLNLFCNCQQAFYYRYCEGQIIPPGIAARVGTGVHKAAEVNHRHKMETGESISIEEMKDIASDTFFDAVNNEGVYFTGTKQELHKELGAGEDLSVKLAGVYGEHIAPQIKPVAAEIKLYAAHPALDVPFSGTIDVVDSEAGIVDLKTASRKWRLGKERETTQPALYRYLWRENGGEDKGFVFHVMAYNGDLQAIHTGQGDLNMQRIVAISRSMLHACKTGVFMPAVAGHWMCSDKWCAWHREACPYAQ